MEGKANFSKRPKQLDGFDLWLTLSPGILRQIYATDYNSDATRLRFDCSSTALRPFDD